MTKISANILFSTVLMLFSLTGCTTKIHNVHILSDKTIDETAKVALVPFTGDGYYRSVFGEWLTHQLNKKTANTIISPAMVEKKLAEHNVSLVFDYQGRKFSLPDGRLISSKQIIKSIPEENREYQTYIFSKEELIEIGQILNVDFVINGSVSLISDRYRKYRSIKLLEVQVIDVKKQSLIGYFRSSIFFPKVKQGFSNNRTVETNDIYDLENITLDILQLFSEKVRAEQ